MNIEIENHQSMNPMHADAKVYKIPPNYDLNQLDNTQISLIDSRSLSFFQNSAKYLWDFRGSINADSVKQLIDRLLKLEFRLMLVESGKYGLNIENERGGTFISFADPGKESSQWYIDLEPKMYNPAHYPPELLEILKFGCFYFSYYCYGARLWPLGMANLAMKDTDFAYFISIYDDIDFPAAELRFMYEDYSGSHIFYDNNHEIWYGGVEEGGIFKLELSLKETIESIFSAHLKEEYPSIDTIIKGKYLASSSGK